VCNTQRIFKMHGATIKMVNTYWRRFGRYLWPHLQVLISSKWDNLELRPKVAANRRVSGLLRPWEINQQPFVKVASPMTSHPRIIWFVVNNAARTAHLALFIFFFKKYFVKLQNYGPVNPILFGKISYFLWNWIDVWYLLSTCHHPYFSCAILIQKKSGYLP